MATNPAQEVVLTQSELAYLMKITGARALVGVSSEPLKLTQSVETIVDHLRRKHLLGASNGREHVDATYEPWLQALFSPSQALVVVRDMPKVGRQLLVFSSKGGTTVLHSMPSEGQHRVAAMAPSEIANMLDSWFPTGGYPEVPPAGFEASFDEVNQSRELIEKGQTQEGVQVLKDRNVPQPTLNEWAEAVGQRKFSGSFATMHIESDEIKQADSFSVLAGPSSAWLIVQESESDELSVIRANAHCRDRIMYAAQTLTGVSPEQFTSVVVDTNGLAYAFAAISRVDLGLQLIRSLTPGELDEKDVSSRLQAGAETLTKAGLCTVSGKGGPVLNLALETAIFPLAQFDRLIQATIARPEMESQAVVHVQRGKRFTSHLVAGDSHVLETGSSSKLALYIQKLYGDFAQNEAAQGAKSFPLELGQLRRMLKGPSLNSGELLRKGGAPAAAGPALDRDLRKQKYHGWIIRIEAGGNTSDEVLRDAAHPIVFLLQGPDRAWVASFATDSDASQGTVQTVDSKSFNDILTKFLS